MGSECLAAINSRAEKHGKGGKKGGRGKRGKDHNPLELIGACQTEIEFDCSTQFDFELTTLIDSLTALEAAKEEAIANGQKPEKPSGDIKSSMEMVRQCVSGLEDDLPEDSECLAAINSRAEKHGKGG